MNKLVKEGLIFLCLFAGLWFALTHIPWEPAKKVGQISKKMEKQLGDTIWEFFQASNEVMSTSDSVYQSVDSMLVRICQANQIDRTKIKLHVVFSDEVNAYALPDGHMVILTGLLTYCDHSDQVAGVIAHELAHIQKGHVMQKLIKEIGVSMLISAAAGDFGGEFLKRTAKTLSSTAFDRAMEVEADEVGVEYLMKAQINPTYLADFFEDLAASETDMAKYFTWMRTHPDTQERANRIREISESESLEYQPVMSEASWQSLQESIKSQVENPWQNIE